MEGIIINKKKRILYLDAWNILLAINAVTHISDQNSNPIGTYIGTANMIRTFVDRFKPEKVFVIFDGPNAGERRRKLFSNYKNKRRVRESKINIGADERDLYEVEGSFNNQLGKLYEFCKLLPVTIVMVPYCEADDVISYLALKNKDEFDNVIISNDRDYLQLIQKGIMVYRWKAKILYDQTKFSEEFGIKTENYIFRKIIMGDTSDLIEGVRGIGEKTFERLKPMLSENIYPELQDFFKMLDEFDYKDCATREKNAIKNTITQRDKMLLSYRLMKLDTDCVLPHHVDMIKLQVEDQKTKVLKKLSAKLQIQKDSFNKLYNGFNDERWLQPFFFLKSTAEIKI